MFKTEIELVRPVSVAVAELENAFSMFTASACFAIIKAAPREAATLAGAPATVRVVERLSAHEAQLVPLQCDRHGSELTTAMFAVELMRPQAARATLTAAL